MIGFDSRVLAWRIPSSSHDSFHALGMPGVVPSQLPAAAAAALPVASVRTGVHGNGDGPSDNGSSVSDDKVKTVNISPETD